MKLSDYMTKPTPSGLVMLAATQERELVIFGELAPDGLEQLAKIATNVEYMEQYTWMQDNLSRGGIKGQLRVRKIVKGDTAPVYILTSKAYDGPGDAQESEVETDETMYIHFKAMAPSGQIKTRYSVPVQGHDLIWEIDVIKDNDGNIIPWTKIDLELPEGLTLDTLPALPDGVFSRVIDKLKADRTEEENNILDDLFQNKFYIKNPTVADPNKKEKDPGDHEFR